MMTERKLVTTSATKLAIKAGQNAQAVQAYLRAQAERMGFAAFRLLIRDDEDRAAG